MIQDNRRSADQLTVATPPERDSVSSPGVSFVRRHRELVERDSIVDDVLELHSDALGADLPGYRGHVYRTLNFSLAFAGEGARRSSFALAAAFHDLGIWSDRTFDYLAPSARRALDYAARSQPSVDPRELERMILWHHRLRGCHATDDCAVEAFRRADWVDVSWGLLRFGLPASLVREVQASFKNSGFHRCLLREGLSWARRHPARPLPVLRW